MFYHSSIKEYRYIVQTFLALAYATESELGWDPSFVCNKGIAKRALFVRNQKYTIVENIYDASEDRLIGRGCRIFLGETDAGRRVIIKDVWMLNDRIPEHENWEAIREAVVCKFGETKWLDVKQHFFTYEASELVSINGFPDDTRLSLSDQDIKNTDRFKLVSPEDEWERYRYPRAPRTMFHMKHYRTVLSEVAQPLCKLRKLRDAWAVVTGIMKGSYLKSFSPMWQLIMESVVALLSEIDYVHRDISIGNSYLYDGRVILGDLEYAKAMEWGRTREIRTVIFSRLLLHFLVSNFVA